MHYSIGIDIGGTFIKFGCQGPSKNVGFGSLKM